MKRRSFMAGLLALPLVPVAASQAMAKINPAWAAAEVPDGCAAWWGIDEEGTYRRPTLLLDVSTDAPPTPVIFKNGTFYLDDPKVFDPRKEDYRTFSDRFSKV